MVITKDKPIEVSDILNAVYPVGSIYMSVSNVSPKEFIGGEWEPLQDRFLIGAGKSLAVNEIGGEASHTLTVEEMPTHSHPSQNGGFFLVVSSKSSPYPLLKEQGLLGGTGGWWANTEKDATGIDNTGGGQPHNNLPPYLAVYMWKRTA